LERLDASSFQHHPSNATVELNDDSADSKTFFILLG